MRKITPEMHPVQYRLSAASEITASSLRRVANVQAADTAEKVVTGSTAGFVVLISSFNTVANFTMLVVLLVLQSLDFLVCFGVIYKSKTQRFSSDLFIGGLVGKLMRLGIVLLACALDLTFGAAFPAASGASLMLSVTPITKAAFAWLIAGEGISIITHIRKSEGDDAIPALVIRALDRLRMGGKEPPMRREYDREAIELETEERRAVEKEAERISRKRRKDQ